MRRVGWTGVMVAALILSGNAAAQQTGQADVPKAHPGEKTPDLQQQKSKDNGRAVPDSANAPKSQSPASANQHNDADGTSTSGGKKNQKKHHNKQTHGAQKHNPDNQA